MLNNEDKIVDLIQKLSKGDENCDFSLLDDFFENNPKLSSELAERICHEHRREEIGKRAAKFDQKKGFDRLVNQFNNKPKSKKAVKPLFIKISSIVAAVVGVIIVLSYLNSNNYQKTDILSQYTFEQEIEAPLLITQDGVYCLTDNTQEIKDNENYEVVKSDSKLSYSARKEIKELNDKSSEIVYNIIKVPPRYTYELNLSDGTEILLNAATVLKYPVVLGEDERVVEIDGEAYFKVSKSDVPFIVKCNGVEIKVYGTEFNVNSFDNQVETVLIEGSIGVSSSICEERTLKPNNLILFNYDDGVVVFNEKVDTDSYTAWTNNTFFYNNQPFGRVIEDIQRWYGVTISYPKELEQQPLTANIKKYDDINELFKFLEVVAGKTIIREERRIYSLN